YTEEWLILYITDVSDLNVESSKKAGDVICRFFLILNKDILTVTNLKQIIQHIDYDSKEIEVTIAKEILNLIKLADRKALLIVDEHVILFEKDPVSISDFTSHNSKLSTNIRQAFEPMSAQADSQKRFIITRNGIRMSEFRIIYIRSSPSISNHTRKVREFSDVTHITFKKIKNLFKETGKPTPSTADFTKPVDLENQIPVNDDVILIDKLGLLGKEKQSLSKTTGITKETFDQVTSPIEIMSTTLDNFDNLDDSISKDTS
ncbi:11013_t:CDS:2, partial [Funneliformis caledonium]